MNFSPRSKAAVLVCVAALGAAVAQSAPAFFVNDQPVSERELKRRHDDYASLKLQGTVAQDLKRFILSQTVLNEAVFQDAAQVTVPSEELASSVERFRKERELTCDEEYLAALEKLGYTESEYLEAVDRDLRINKRVDEITAGVTATEAELKLYYELFSKWFEVPGKPLDAFDDLRPSVRRQLEANVVTVKRGQALEEWVSALISNANVTFPEGSDRDWFNPVVASVDDLEIRLYDLDNAVYTNPQVFVDLVSGNASQVEARLRKVKPEVLEGLINAAVARQYASRSKRGFFGSGAALVALIERDQTRKVRVTDAEVRAFYAANKAAFSSPASAELVGARFASLKDANAFRWSLVRAKGGNFAKLAAKFRGKTTRYGPITPANLTGPHTALLDPKKLRRVGKAYVSPVIREDATIEVFLVSKLTPSKVQPFDSVRAQVAEWALEGAQGKVARAWWAAERQRHVIVNNLPQVQRELEARAARE